MLELATSQPRTTPLGPHYQGIKPITGFRGKNKEKEKKLPDKNSLNVAVRVSLFISSYDNMYERHFSLVVLISIPFRHSINNCHKVGLSYIVNPQPHHPFRFNMTQARSHSQ
jgi:hypothetical protein